MQFSMKSTMRRMNAVLAAVVVWGLMPGIASATVFNLVPNQHIQFVINIAVNGDQIVLAPGTYNQRVNFAGKAIILRSLSGNPANTIINGGSGDSVIFCVSGEGPGTRLEGLTITGGTGNTAFTGVPSGGGMINNGASPSVINCIFSGNSAFWGGGMMNANGSTPLVTNCTFSGNTAGDKAGGMWNQLSSPTISNCTFSGNSASNFGGGMHNELNSSPAISSSTFSGNTASVGGGMFNISSNPTMTLCIFSGNSTSNDGGGMHNENGSPGVINCTFSENTATNDGGGIHNSSGSPSFISCTFSGNSSTHGGGMYNSNTSPTVTNCTFRENSANTGGGMSNNFGSNPSLNQCTFSGNSAVFIGGGLKNVNSSPSVSNCIFSGNTAGNDGGGLFNNGGGNTSVTNCTFSVNFAVVGSAIHNSALSNLTVTNSLLWGDSTLAIFNDFSSSIAVNYSNVQGGITGIGNIDLDPLFIDPFGPDGIPGTPDDDLRLMPGSPSTDAGDNTAAGISGITADLDGNPRFYNDTGVVDSGVGTPPIVDMGAYERQTNSPPPPAIINVPVDFATIQAAINASVNGDEIIVAPGPYPEVINFNNKAITLRAVNASSQLADPFGPLASIIDGTGFNESVVLCINGEGAGTILEGFTITGGNAFTGGGMRIDTSSPTVTNCTFIGNSSELHGGGMYNVSGSSPTVTNCTFSGNSIINGGGAGGGMGNSFNCSPTVTNCTFSGNSGGGMFNQIGCNPTVTNCAFTGNTSFGMGNFAGSAPNVTNCTFSGNTASNLGGGGIVNNQASSPTVTNCILWGDSGSEIVNFDSGSTTTISFSNVQGGLGAGFIDGGGNQIDVDPLFSDADGADNIPGTPDDDLRLASGSPGTNAGDNTATGLSGITTDLEGNPRFYDDTAMANIGNGSAPIVDLGAYERQVNSSPSIRNVPVDFSTIQGAILASTVIGAEIIVAPDTYLEVINFGGREINLHSASGNPADTIIDGTGLNNSVVLCISGEGEGTILEGFTITGGMGNTAATGFSMGGGMLNDGSSPTVTKCIFSGNTVVTEGGGMVNTTNSNPTITYCNFIGNTAGSGAGGMNNVFSSSPTITNCTFSGNTASAGGGGGMINGNNSSPTVTNCTFSGNTSSNSGGGMMNSVNSSPTVTNCTFSRNSATSNGGGGMYNLFTSNPIVTNSIFWGNSPNEIINFPHAAISAPTISFSTVQGDLGVGSIDGGFNIFTDPLLIDADGADNIPGTLDDDLRLMPGSLSIDSGNTKAPGLVGITTDLDGLPRVSGLAVDRGAYEALVAILNAGDSQLMNPGGGSGALIDDALVDITNESGAAGSTVTVGESATNQFPGAGGYAVLGSQLIVETTLIDGQFFMQVSIPFDQADLNAAAIGNPLSLDLAYYDVVSGNWALAVGANTVNSPGHAGPVGDRVESQGPPIPALSNDLGDYGVYWDSTTQQGFVWANVDHATVFAVGTLAAAPCPADITPAGGNGVVNIDDLVAVLNAFGSCPAPPAPCGADITPAGGNGVVNIDDLVAVLNAFGGCP